MANDTDSFGQYDPTSPTNAFAPTSPAMVAEAKRQEELRAQRVLEASGRKTAAANAPYQNDVRAAQPEIARQEALTRASKAGEAGNDWMYPGIVAGTIGAGILGAGAVGALAGGAAGTTAGGSAALAAPYAAGGAYSAPMAAGTIAAPFAPTAAGHLASVGTVASPFAAPAAGAAGAGAAGAAGAAAAGSAFGLKDALGLAPLALDAAGLVASQIRTKAENDLIEKQKELAAAAKARMAQVQQEGMNRLGSQMLAFAPLNKAMQQMYGQDAGYSPQQMAGIVSDPGAQQGFDNNNPGGPSLEEVKRRKEADMQRQAQVSGAFSPARNPALLQQRTPQAARRF